MRKNCLSVRLPSELMVSIAAVAELCGVTPSQWVRGRLQDIFALDGTQWVGLPNDSDDSDCVALSGLFGELSSRWFTSVSKVDGEYCCAHSWHLSTSGKPQRYLRANERGDVGAKQRRLDMDIAMRALSDYKVLRVRSRNDNPFDVRRCNLIAEVSNAKSETENKHPEPI